MKYYMSFTKMIFLYILVGSDKIKSYNCNRRKSTADLKVRRAGKAENAKKKTGG